MVSDRSQSKADLSYRLAIRNSQKLHSKTLFQNKNIHKDTELKSFQETEGNYWLIMRTKDQIRNEIFYFDFW